MAGLLSHFLPTLLWFFFLITLVSTALTSMASLGPVLLVLLAPSQGYWQCQNGDTVSPGLPLSCSRTYHPVPEFDEVGLQGTR